MMTDYNREATGVPIKDQCGPGFRLALDLYCKDEELLKEDLGNVFKRRTELGWPWSYEGNAMKFLFDCDVPV